MAEQQKMLECDLETREARIVEVERSWAILKDILVKAQKGETMLSMKMAANKLVSSFIIASLLHCLIYYCY